MDKNVLNEKEKYYPLLIKNQIKHENNKKLVESDLKSSNKNIDKMIYFLSDKKERNSFTFFKTFIGNTDDLSNDILSKKLIKVNTDNKSKSKNNIYNASCINNSVKRTKQKIKSKFLKNEEEDLSMNQKINKFESRIDNLLNVINDFEAKFINSPESQKIKDQFNDIINKKIYKDKNTNNYLFKSFNKNEINNNRLTIKENGTMDLNNINNNINININNNNYENNYFITQSINDISHKILNKKQNHSEKKLNTNANNSILKKSNLKNKKKISKCNSNDLKNKTIHNYKDKPKLFKLPLDSLNNNNNLIIKNNRYNNSYKDLIMPLTDRKEREIEDNKILESNDLRNSLKNINKKKNNNCVRINKAASSKNEIRRKTFIKKDGSNKLNLFKTKKKAIEKNLTPLSAQGNPLINNTINGGTDINNKYKDKEKSVNGSAEFIKKKKKENTEFINYILNKRNIIKGNNTVTVGNNQHEQTNNKDTVYNKKSLYNKKK